MLRKKGPHIAPWNEWRNSWCSTALRWVCSTVRSDGRMTMALSNLAVVVRWRIRVSADAVAAALSISIGSLNTDSVGPVV